MQYRRLGRTELWVSTVGFGTAQLRRVPEQQAIDAVKLGVSLGVNLIHAAPDYEGADELVAQAVAETGRDVFICSQGYGDRENIEWLFETACRKFKKRRLELFGIACIDDREMLGEKVWEPGGQVEFLLKMKRKGRLQGIFCTTHGGPDYILRLAQSDVFDAIMMAYNPLGFHLLSYNQKDRPSEAFKESLPANADLMAAIGRLDLGLMIMKPIAGGLLCEGKAFPPHLPLVPEVALPNASEILRIILLSHPEVSCVIPGTASVEEARENACAGHEPLLLSEERGVAIHKAIRELRDRLCSRCGHCDALCSKGLPISWLFRDSYIMNHRAMTFETLDRLRYQMLHPWDEAACATCTQVTCECPEGIDIPKTLIVLHRDMRVLEEQGFLPLVSASAPARQKDSQQPFSAVLFSREVPAFLERGREYTLRLTVENTGTQTWVPTRISGAVHLALFLDDQPERRENLRGETPPGEKCNFALQLRAALEPGSHVFRFVLVYDPMHAERDSVELMALNLEVR